MSDQMRELNGKPPLDNNEEIDTRNAMRQLADGDIGFDEPPGQETQETETQEPEYLDPTEPKEHKEEQKPEPKKQEQPKKRQLSDKRVDESLSEAQRRRLNSAFDRIKARDADFAAMEARFAEQQRQFAEQQKIISDLQSKAKLEANPMLKRANELLDVGWTPENAEAEAEERRKDGDKEGYDVGRALARHMRNIAAEREAEARNSQENQLRTQWRQLPYGTPDFERAVSQLKPGAVDANGQGPGKEFNDCWEFAADQMVQRKKASADPWDQECVKQYQDPKSEFGQRLTYFLRSTDFGRNVSQHPLGIVIAFDIVKMDMRIYHQDLKLKKLQEENARLRGYTSPAVASLSGGGREYAPTESLPERSENPREFERQFSKLKPEEMRAYIRRNESA